MRPSASLRTVMIAALVAYGVAFAVVGTVKTHHRLPASPVLQSSRLSTLEGQEHAWDTGIPLLMQTRSGVQSTNPKLRSTYLPAASTDDPGVFVYLPAFGHALGSRDLVGLLGWLYACAVGVTLALYPVVFFLLFDSLLAGLVSAPLLFAAWKGFDDSDIYFVSGWIVLLGMPLIWLAWRRWRPAACALLLVVAVAASFASAMRSQSGVPVVAAALVVGAVRLPRWRLRVAFVAATLLAYLSVSPFAMNAVMLARDRAVANPQLDAGIPKAHPLWHPAYLGFGWLDNRYGIRWDDAVGAAVVAEVDPSAAYLSKRYESILRRKWLHIVWSDPGFALRTVASKAEKLVGDAVGHSRWTFLLLPFMLAAGRRRRIPTYLGLLAPAIPLTAAPLLLAVPVGSYEIGWLAVWKLTGILGGAWLAAEVGALVAVAFAFGRDGRLTLTWPTRRRFVHISALALIAAAAAVAAQAGATTLPRRASDIQENFESLTLSTPLAPVPASERPVASWSLDPTGLGRWQSTATTEATDRGLEITATGDPGSVQLTSPSATLPAGTYVVHLDGSVENGGLEVEAEVGGKAIAVARFWAGERRWHAGDALIGSLTVPARGRIRVVLRDWPRSGAAPSTWLLRRVDVLSASSS